MSHPTVTRPLLALTVALWIGLVAALGAARMDHLFTYPLLEHGDIAVNAMQIENAKYLRELYGNYSRFEFNHPGPAFFYVYAAFDWILHDALGVVPSPANAHLLAALCLQCFFFAVALALLSVHLRPRAWLPFALLAAAIIFGTVGNAFVSIWPPHVLLMPFLCFLTACISLAIGRIEHLPWVVLSGGFLFHGHVAQPLFVGGLGGLALATVWWRARQPGTWRFNTTLLAPHRNALRLSVGLAGVFLLPLLLDVLLNGIRGNVATIIGTFADNSSDKKSLLQSLLYFLSFATSTQEQDSLFTTLSPTSWSFFAERKGYYLFLAASLLAPAAILARWPARFSLDERRFLKACYAFLGAAFVLCLLWGKAQAGGMHHFNGFFYYGVYYFALLVGLLIVTRFIDSRMPASLSTALLCCAAVAGTWLFRAPRLPDELAGLVLRRGVEAALAAEPSARPKLLRFEHYAWPEAASVALELKRRGLGVYMTPWWTFMFGSRHDEDRLGDEPERHGNVWWLTLPEAGHGHPLNPELSLFTEPATLDPAGTVIRFGEKANGIRYLVSGLSSGNVDLAWTDLPRLTFQFTPLPSPTDVRLTFDAQSNVDDHGVMVAQPAEIFFNGTSLGRVAVTERASVSVRVPREVWNQKGPATLELRFPDAHSGRTFKRPGYLNWRAWGLWSVSVAPAP